LLRSVVIAGQRVTGEVARSLALAAGGRDVRSVIATGNVLFRSSRAPRTLERDLERACAAHYGQATEMVVKTADEWRALMAANPFGPESLTSPSRVLVWAMRTPLPDAGLAQLVRRAGPDERVERTSDGDLYLYFGGPIAESKLPAGFRLSALGAVGTNRNWNTARKITAALAEMEHAPD
jgi:uncharacterized protein (DUF1697 family)